MAKAINWPLEFLDVIKSEPVGQRFSAIRPGTLYFDNQYWVEGEIVDIRVNHEVVRSAQIVGDLKTCSVKELELEDFAQLKPGLDNQTNILSYLNQNYPDKNLTESSPVTLVYYQYQKENPEHQ